MKLVRFVVNLQRVKAIRDLITLLENDDAAKEFKNRLMKIETREQKFQRYGREIKKVRASHKQHLDAIAELELALKGAIEVTSKMYRDTWHHNEALKKAGFEELALARTAAMIIRSDAKTEAKDVIRKAEEQAIVIKQDARAEALLLADRTRLEVHKNLLMQFLGSMPTDMYGPYRLEMINPDESVSPASEFGWARNEKLTRIVLRDNHNNAILKMDSYNMEFACKAILEHLLMNGIGALKEATKNSVPVILDTYEPQPIPKQTPISRMGHMGVQIHHPNRYAQAQYLTTDKSTDPYWSK